MNIFHNRNDNLANMSYVDSEFNVVETSTSYSFGTYVKDDNGTLRGHTPTYFKVIEYVYVICYLIICVIGLIGNCLVIYVVLRYAKMKTVTNMYILNLAVSDVMFLIMIPLTITTVIVKHWIFGYAMCKIYFVLSATNTFGSALNLCVMSADRYMAVCHPIKSLKYRTPLVAFTVCMSVWIVCGLMMLPIIMYTTTVNNSFLKGKFSCIQVWPASDLIHPGKAFILYSFFLAYVVPVSLITIFYIMIIYRLRKAAATKKSTGTRRTHGRVTRLIITVVAAYVFLWLPYWCFQVDGIFNVKSGRSLTLLIIIHIFTILSLTNSMLNPFLYAFLCENFRQCFIKAFKFLKCCNKTRSVCNEKSNYPSTSQTYMRTGTCATVEDGIQLTALDDNFIPTPDVVEDGVRLQDG